MVALPLSWARALGGVLGGAAFGFLKTERRRTLEHLALAYGETLDEAAREAIGRQVFRNAGLGAGEGAFLSLGRVAPLLARTRIEGLEHVLGVLAEGRGLIFVTAHYGQWELLLAALAPLASCETAAVGRPMPNPYLNRLIEEMRQRFCTHVFTRGETGREYIRFLRRGNVLAVLGDMDTSKGDGLFVPFFGRPAWTQTGIARLARMGRAQVVTGFIERDAADPSRHVVRIDPPIEDPDATLGEEAWIARMTQAFTARIEAAVRRRPDQWLWMHRRWRRRPPENKAASG